VVGYALTTYNAKSGLPVIGFDMGGERIVFLLALIEFFSLGVMAEAL